MGRKKREKKKKKIEEPIIAAPENTAAKAAQPEQPDLHHLSGEWREFYRLVINRLSMR